MQDFRLYVILDVDICTAYGNTLEIARQTILGGVDILQLRAKNSSGREIQKMGQAIKNLVQKSRVSFLLNDRVELTRIIDADGVHLGQEDLPLKDARRILGDNKIIGLSTHSLDEATEAERQGADYIGIGPIFATAIKPKTTPLTPEIIPKFKDRVKVPFVAVGGINLDNLDQVLSLGVKRVGVCRAIITAKDVFNATKEFRRRLYKETSPE